MSIGGDKANTTVASYILIAFGGVMTLNYCTVFYSYSISWRQGGELP